MNQPPPSFPSEPGVSPAYPQAHGPAPAQGCGMPGPQQAPGNLPPPSATPYPHHGAPIDHVPGSRWSWWHHSYLRPPPPASGFASQLPAVSGGPPHFPPSHGYEHFSWHGRYPARSFYPHGFRRGPRLLPLVLVGTAVYFATKSYYRRHLPHHHEYAQQQQEERTSDRQFGHVGPVHQERHACGPWAAPRRQPRVEQASQERDAAAASEEPRPTMTRLEARLKAREQEWASRWDRAMQEQPDRHGPSEKWV